ncbi:hypothetical protein [Proteiniphilum sp. UBA5463]|jgi:hypothetical protein|uniref:hypothetical protein n=1 Tax=Proteiniphilum sp. UBA5463 TaxID=1947281 RepID=UPI002579B9FD|nr:hypothetical protein [Proteiniphilum sp. UBA5463]
MNILLIFLAVVFFVWCLVRVYVYSRNRAYEKMDEWLDEAVQDRINREFGNRIDSYNKALSTVQDSICGLIGDDGTIDAAILVNELEKMKI